MERIICFVALTVMLGCGGQLKQLAVETMQNAQIALTSAETMGAQENRWNSVAHCSRDARYR